jgi:hypothetical protein
MKQKMDFQTLIVRRYLLLAIFQIWIFMNLKSYKHQEYNDKNK